MIVAGIIGTQSELATGSSSQCLLYNTVRDLFHYIPTSFVQSRCSEYLFLNFFKQNVILLALFFFFNSRLMFFVHKFLFDQREKLRKLRQFKDNSLNNVQ